MSRPESQLPPNLYYNQQESVKYTNCNRTINIQTQLSERAIQLLDLNPEECSLVLDIGCGSGISGFYLSQEGVNWVGLDISESMLNVAQQEKTEGELLFCDIGQGFKFRPGVFDAAISISVIQWLCVSLKKSENPYRRCTVFFESLRNCLKNNARAVFQFYPENNEQINMITSTALRAGFNGDIVVDYPNSAKAKKLYLVVQLGGQSSKKTMDIIQGLVEESDDEKVKVIGRQQKKIMKQKKQKKINEKSKLWIMKRKENRQDQVEKLKKQQNIQEEKEITWVYSNDMMHGQSKLKTEILSEEEIKLRAEKGQQILDSLEYFFKVRKNQVNQPEDQLAFSELMARLCPEIATIYNYRREVLQTKFDHLGGQLLESKNIDAFKQLIKLIQSEFMLIAILLKQHPKSYTLWTHRQWMVLRSQEIDLLIDSINQEKQFKLIEAIKQEYELCCKMLDKDERNFHVWNYRNWLSSISAFGKEDEFTKKKIEQNFSNFSAYHFRSKYFMKNYNSSEQIIKRIKTEQIFGLLPLPFNRLKDETELIQQAIYIQPKEHGVYLYHRWLVGVVQPFGVTKVLKVSNNSISLQFNRAVTNVENCFEIFNEDINLKIINVKIEGINTIISFEEQQTNKLTIKIDNQIYENGALETATSEDESSKFLISSQINLRINNEGFTFTNTIQEEFKNAINVIHKYLDENIDFIKQVIQEERENRFPYIQILYLLQFKLRTQKLIDETKTNTIINEALQHCEQLKKIQNDHQAQFLYEFWSQL